MRIISFCANSIRDAAERGFFTWAIAQDADFICIQDLGAQEYDLQDDVFFPAGYNAYFFDAVDGPRNGVAIYCKELPKAIMTGIGSPEFDMEGLYIQADFESLSVGSLLVPAARAEDGDSLEKKAEFLEIYQNQLGKVRNKRRNYIICANWNIAHSADDLQEPEQASGVSGFLSEDCQWMDELQDLGYVDAFREINSDSDEFSWWPDGDRSAGGWRVDSQWISTELKYAVEYGTIYKKEVFSEHAPVTMDYELEL